MKPERMTEELAAIEYNNAFVGYGSKDRPDYLHPTEGFNHLHRLLNRMDDDTVLFYLPALEGIVRRDAKDPNGLWSWECNVQKVKATTAQMAEAILKAYGKWEEE